MNKVYVSQINRNKHLDFSSAETYGEIVNVIEDMEYSTISHSESNMDIRKRISEVASEYRGYDYLLMVGDPIIIALLFHEIMEQYGACTLLKWDNLKRTYTPHLISDALFVDNK